jgi:hypothetical protein
MQLYAKTINFVAAAKQAKVYSLMDTPALSSQLSIFFRCVHKTLSIVFIQQGQLACSLILNLFSSFFFTLHAHFSPYPCDNYLSIS